ncbi:MAG TPA: helix-turn-helix domain-containing protein [Solirubrobacteraceae bacterium]|nr:helix-turn-helix domain-containing protein [Solirubrobacteraceae bacterium]
MASADKTASQPDFAALEALTEAVASGAGLPEVVRAAARALDASLVLVDRTSHVLAVAARSPVEEQALLAGGEGIESIDLRLADEDVGVLRVRARSAPRTSLLGLITTLIASEVERIRAPERASAVAVSAFLEELFAGTLGDDAVARADELGLDVVGGAVALVIRVRPHAPVEDGWRSRVLAVIERGARAIAPTALAAPTERSDPRGIEVTVLIPGDDAVGSRAAAGVLRELQSGLPGHTFTIGVSRTVADPAELRRAGLEAELAVNVADGAPEKPILAFEDTGTYKLLLGQDPNELQRFYDETVATLVAYDSQYETELVGTVEAFLDADGNVAATSQRLFTHRHTVRYRLDRVRELTGLDVGSSDGREKLSLGLKAMRVLGIAAPAGPASEAGTEAGRVPRR